MSDIKFSIVVPCYNEASRGNFEDRIHRIQEFFEKYDDTEVIFINDGSRDDTVRVLHKMGATCYGSRINHGKGFALMLGARKSHGTYVVFMDADISVDMEMFEDISKNLKAQGAQIIILGCTELSIIKGRHKLDDSFLDSLEVLAAAVITECGAVLREEYRRFIS